MSGAAPGELIRSEYADGVLIVTLLVDNLDHAASSRLREAVSEAADQTSDPVVLDISVADTIQSISIGALITLAQVFKQKHQRFVLAGVSGHVRETLTICRLDKFFEMHGSLESATAALAG